LGGYGGDFNAGGIVGITGTAGAQSGVFYGSGNGFSAGGEVHGGLAMAGGFPSDGYPRQSGPAGVIGYYAGYGPTITITNARSVHQLAQTVTTLSFNEAVFLKLSLQLTFGNGIMALSFGPPTPLPWGGGYGFSVSKVDTKTLTAGGGCR
jgi:hypothetical protein